MMSNPDLEIFLWVICEPRDGGRHIEQKVNLVAHLVKLLDEALVLMQKNHSSSSSTTGSQTADVWSEGCLSPGFTEQIYTTNVLVLVSVTKLRLITSNACSAVLLFSLQSESLMRCICAQHQKGLNLDKSISFPCRSLVGS